MGDAGVLDIRGALQSKWFGGEHLLFGLWS